MNHVTKRSRTDVPPSPPSPYDAIKTLWSEIEPFLEIEDTIAVAQTCRTFDNIIIDSATRKVKISHFSVNGFTNAGERINKGNNKDERIIEYIPNALNRIYFPSIKQLAISFPRTKISDCEDDDLDDDGGIWYRPGRQGRGFEDGYRSIFPLLSINLAYARDLEYLAFDGTMMMSMDYGAEMSVLIRFFGRNLRGCTKLVELEVRNSGPILHHNREMVGRWGEYEHSVELMRALIPTLKDRKNDLKRIAYSMTYKQTIQFRDCQWVDAMYCDFFAAILSVKSLISMDICIVNSHHLLNSLVSAVRLLVSSGADPPLGLRGLELRHCPYHEDSLVLFPITPLVNYLSPCRSLTDVTLQFPRELWQEVGNITKWMEFIKHTPSILSIALIFDNAKSQQADVNLLGLVEGLLVDRQSTDTFLTAFKMFNLAEVCVLQVRRIISIMEKQELELDTEDFELCGAETSVDIWNCGNKHVDLRTMCFFR